MDRSDVIGEAWKVGKIYSSHMVEASLCILLFMLGDSWVPKGWGRFFLRNNLNKICVFITNTLKLCFKNIGTIDP